MSFRHFILPLPTEKYLQRGSRTASQRISCLIKMAAKIANSCKPVKFPLRSLVLRTFYSSKSLENMGKITSFSNPEVQSLLKKLTGRNLDKIYAMRRGEFEVPSYKLMTDAEYLEVIFLLFVSLRSIF